MSHPKFSFCDDLNAPELCVILDMQWWSKNKPAVNQWFDSQFIQDYAMSSNMLFIADANVKTAFLLKWG